MKILFIFGTRPEAIKMAPIINEVRKYTGSIESRICVTAQHREMLDQVLELFGITPDYDLNIMRPGQDLFDVTCSVLQGLRNLYIDENPNIILVQGDTTTAMAASLAAFYCSIPIGHIEAGLRTGKKYAPWPEEINRKIISVMADIHFAPTNYAKNNLIQEGVSENSIHITGNTVIDSLLLVTRRLNEEHKLRDGVILKLTNKWPVLDNILENDQKKMILVTGHRRENFGKGFENICRALINIADQHHDVDIVYPVHLNPNVQRPVNRIIGNHGRIHLISPLDYLSFVYLMNRAHIIITDSGGIQEEAPSLGKPVLVMRESTERQEAVEAGTVKLVGTDSKIIVNTTHALLTDSKLYSHMSSINNPYGDGTSANRIANVLLKDICYK